MYPVYRSYNQDLKRDKKWHTLSENDKKVVAKNVLASRAHSNENEQDKIKQVARYD